MLVQDPNRDSRRRNVITALLLFALALGFYLAYFWSMSHRH
jgi:hypothetical protein